VPIILLDLESYLGEENLRQLQNKHSAERGCYLRGKTATLNRDDAILHAYD